MAAFFLRGCFVLIVVFVSTNVGEVLPSSGKTEANVYPPVRTATSDDAQLPVLTKVAAPSTSVPTTTTTAARTVAAITYTYAIATKGTVRSDLNEFAEHVRQTLHDPNGWSLGGSIEFRAVESGADLTIWLTEPSLVPSFSSDCDVALSCRVGRNVVINDERWASGSQLLQLDVDSYRHMVLNHEMGHWLGFDHASCSAPGGPAAVMQQQSKGLLGGCAANPWPLPSERLQLATSKKLPF